MRANEDIREAKGVIPYWMIADKLGIHVNTLYLWMRHEMPMGRKKEVLFAVKKAKEEFVNELTDSEI